MLRGIALVFLTFILQSLSAQKIFQGTVVDKVSREPVPYVHVFLTSGTSGAITDLNGEFSINIGSIKNDSLKFSSIGYKTKKLPVKNFSDQPLIIELEEDRVLLPGFVVHELSAKEFIRKCVTRIPNNYSQHASSSKAFYWSSVRHKDTYTDFYEGYLSLSKERIKYDSTIRSQHDSLKHIQLFDSLQDVINFDVINQTSMFVNPVNLDDWKFDYLYSSEQTDESFVVIEAAMIQNPFEKSNETNTLKIFVQTPSYAIVRIDFTYRWTGGKRYYWQDDVLFSLSKLDGTVEYAKNLKQKYALNYLFIGTEFSFTKRFNAATVLRKAFINHELVIPVTHSLNQKPVVRWSDYLDATRHLGAIKSDIGQK